MESYRLWSFVTGSSHSAVIRSFVCPGTRVNAPFFSLAGPYPVLPGGVHVGGAWSGAVRENAAPITHARDFAQTCFHKHGVHVVRLASGGKSQRVSPKQLHRFAFPPAADKRADSPHPRRRLGSLASTLKPLSSCALASCCGFD